MPNLKDTDSFKIACLFAAIGGFCRAFEEVGGKILWANEKDKFAAETFRLNFPHIRYVNKPVEELTVRGDALEPIDVLTAGFPCQPFSIAGEKRGFQDKRGPMTVTTGYWRDQLRSLSERILGIMYQ